MITFFQAIALGIIEGITEFLPISSTVHLDFATKFLGIVHSDFVTTFMVLIQLGAIAAVGILFFKQITMSKELIVKMFIGFLPVAVVGFLLYPMIKHVLLGNVIIEITAIAVGGIVFLYYANRFNQSSNELSVDPQKHELSFKDFLKLGCWQILALIPGVSRSGAILIGGLTQNISVSQTVNAAFLLAIPTMVAASGYDLLKTGFSFTSEQWSILLVGTIVSGIVAFFVAQFFMKLMRKPGALRIFGWYRIILAAILLVIFF